MVGGGMIQSQAINTTTVQGTVYLANGQPDSGTLQLSWPAFTTASNQAVTAGKLTVPIASDGFMSVNLSPNQGATPAGLYYTAIYYLSDGSTSTEYWIVPAAAQASLGSVRAQLMPAAQAVQAVSKSYVDQAITELTGSLLTASGGTLSGGLYLNGDPTQPLQAADKHYVDSAFSQAVPLAGGAMTGFLTTPSVNGVVSPAAGSSQTTLQAAVNAAGSTGAVEIPPNYAGTDGFTNPNGVSVTDLRSSGAQPNARNVKEFGAVCDGNTDDTNALQTALNYAKAHHVALSIPQGICKTHTLNWHGESLSGASKQVSALMGFPGQDVLQSTADSPSLLAYTRIQDLTIYVDQSVDVSCTVAVGRQAAGNCTVNRPLESNTVLSQGGNGLNGTAGTGSAWAVGNCAIAMPASTGAGGNGLQLAEIENLEIVATGIDPMSNYTGAHSSHSCGLYLAQWPKWSEFRNIDINGLNTGIALPALPGSVPAGLSADSNRWQNITIQGTHGFTAAAGSNNELDNVVAMVGNSAATGEPPTGIILDLGSTLHGWTVRNAVVLPTWSPVQPALTVIASGGAVTGVTLGTEHGLGLDPYGTQIPLAFSGSCTSQAVAAVTNAGAISSVSVLQGGVGCSGTTMASVNATGNWDTAAPVNLIAGQNMTVIGGNLQKGNGGYTLWNAASSQSYGTQLGGGGTLQSGGSYAGMIVNNGMGSAFQVDQFPGVDFGAKLQSCLGTVNATYGGTCDARNFTGTLSMGSNLTISTGNSTVLFPCATIATANQVIVTAGTRNATLRGCALRGASTTSGSQGGTVFLYSGSNAMVQVGDPMYAVDTTGFHLDNAVINTTVATSATAQGLLAYRTQEMDLESLYFLGNSNQTGMTLDGTGNYTGGTYFDDAFNGFQTAVHAIGHQIANAATTDWLNASTFVRLHIDCPTSSGSPISGTYGINLQQADGNTFTGGDVEGCSTALHLGANAQNNTIVGLRNENSSNQVVADAGSSYNNWMTGGTMYTGALTDNGTRNSFLDTFHRSFNGVNGDWYGSQKDATVTNHFRVGIGSGNERGLLNRYQTDYGYRWTMGLSDATAGEQFYQVLDELNNVYRISIGQYNNGQSSTNNQTVLNASGTGAIVLNGSNNAGTGGVVFGSGGASENTVATINNAGNAQFNGSLQVGGASTFASSTTIKNQADAEIDASLWAGATASQKESYLYKDWNGNSQWFMVKDASNNWALNSALGGLDSFKAYQSTNSGDTYINASNATGVVRVNYESGAGTAFNIYGGNSSTLYASFTGAGAIKFPGLAASSGQNCLQIDNSGYITNTGTVCGTGNSVGSVNAGQTGQIASYSGNGASLSGISVVPMASGGTGASSSAGALANLGALPVSGGTLTGPLAGPSIEGALQADQHQSPSGTGNNGISTSLTQCVSQSYVCKILAPALYALTEAQPYGIGNPLWEQPYATSGPPLSAPTGCVEDDRWGGPMWLCNNGVNVTSDNRYQGQSTFSQTVTSMGNGTYSSVPNALSLQHLVYTGTRDFYNNETEISAMHVVQQTNSPASTYFMNLFRDQYSPGDSLGMYMVNRSPGALLSQNEGHELIHSNISELGSVWAGTLNSLSCGSSSDCTLNMTQLTSGLSNAAGGYPGSIASALPLIDVTQADTSGYIAAVNPGLGQLTGSSTVDWNTKYGATTATTTTTAAVQDSGANTFPRSNQVVSVASTTGFSTGQTACIFDAKNAVWDCTQITAIGSGTLTLAALHDPYNSGSTIAQGGLTGYLLSADADDTTLTNSHTYDPEAGLSGGIMRDAHPILSNNSGNVIQLFANLDGTSQPVYRTHAYATMGSGGTASATVSGGAVTSCTATGGAGYAGNWNPPQLVVSGITFTTAPVLWASNVTSGSLSGCTVVTPGSGISGTIAVAVVPSNPYHIFPAARVWNAYNGTTGALDGSSVQTDAIVGTFTAGDTINQVHAGTSRTSGLNMINANYQQPGNHTNFTSLTAGNFGASEFEGWFENYNYAWMYQLYPPVSKYYQIGMGQYTTPRGFVFSGPHANSIYMQMPPYGSSGNSQMGAVYVDCVDVMTGSNVCSQWTTPYPVIGVSNQNNGGNANDALFYNPSTFTWTMTAGAQAQNGNTPSCTLTFGPSGLSSVGSGCGSGSATATLAGTQTFAGSNTFSTATQFAGISNSFRQVATTSGGGAITDNVLLTDGYIQGVTTYGNITEYLPLGSSGEHYYHFYKSSSQNQMIISANGGAGIDGQTGYTLNGQFQSVTLMGNSTTGWTVVGDMRFSPVTGNAAGTITAGAVLVGEGLGTGQIAPGKWVDSGKVLTGSGAAVPTGPSITTTNDCVKFADTAGTLADAGSGCATGGTITNTPAWLQYLGNGAQGSNLTASGAMSGDYYYTNFTVPYGNTVTCASYPGCTIHASGTCTIAGSIVGQFGSSGNGLLSGTGGGGGGGTAAGAAGKFSYLSPTVNASSLGGGTAGAASGGAGGAGNTAATQVQQIHIASGSGSDGLFISGAGGGQGGNSGGAGGYSGSAVTLICGTLTGTDGTHTGSINVSGSAGGASTGNNIGAGGGGAGGVVILSSQSTVTTWPTVTTTGGAGGSCGAFTGCGAGGAGGTGWSYEVSGW